VVEAKAGHDQMTNRYANLGAEIIRGSELFAALYIEVTDDGSVSREVGLNVQGEVVYKFPWPGSSFRGTCDLATFDLGDSPNDISPKEFDRLYGTPLDPDLEAASIRAWQGPSIIERIRHRLARAT
jgi:hypothetical protein